MGLNILGYMGDSLTEYRLSPQVFPEVLLCKWSHKTLNMYPNQGVGRLFGPYGEEGYANVFDVE